MGHLSPLVRISLGLVILTSSILLVADMVGLLPRPDDDLVEKRLEFSERLATQAAAGTSRADLAVLRRILVASASRDDDLVSAGLREPGGRLIFATDAHREHWQPDKERGSTLTHVRIPLLNAGKPWATLEVRFKDSPPLRVLAALWERSVLPIVSFVMATGFIGYLLYMRRTLRHLDPSAVVPTRVQAALDCMSEGVVLVDGAGQIVLANSSFVEKVGIRRSELLGTTLQKLNWKHSNAPDIALSMPWDIVFSEAESSTGTQLSLRCGGEDRLFVVNASPVLDGWDKAKGAIITFDEVTELARRTEELEREKARADKSNEELQLQKQEFEELSKRDPLTGVSNRRAYLRALEAQLEIARRGETELSCVMLDVDHFKKVNDEHGHSTGDEVIQRIASFMREHVRSNDFVCRWGGEEFVLVVEKDIEIAASIAERMRKLIDSPGFAPVPVTVSLGVASVDHDIEDVHDLIDRADTALYASKQAGRNRVSRWDQIDHPGQVAEEGAG